MSKTGQFSTMLDDQFRHVISQNSNNNACDAWIELVYASTTADVHVGTAVVCAAVSAGTATTTADANANAESNSKSNTVPTLPNPTTPTPASSGSSSRTRRTTLLIQPTLFPGSTTTTASSSLPIPSTSSSSTLGTTTRPTRASRRSRGTVINYTQVDDEGDDDDGDDAKKDGDHIPDAGALDDDATDGDFVGGNGSGRRVGRPSKQQQQGRGDNSDLDQSYLGQVPPARFIKSRGFLSNAANGAGQDLDIGVDPYGEIVTRQIRAQVEDARGEAWVGWMDSLDFSGPLDDEEDTEYIGNQDPSTQNTNPECRVILSLDVQISTHHLTDHIEWDLLSPLTPEAFSLQLCADLGLSGEAIPLIAHAIHEELCHHRRDIVDWGVLGALHPPSAPLLADSEGAVKDRTGLGLGLGVGSLGRPARERDGRYPKPLRSAWRDWAEAEEYATRWEVLSPEEVKRREMERERAGRRLRRETIELAIPLLALGYDIFIFILTAIKTVQHSLEMQRLNQSSITQIIIRDGTLYFLLMLVVAIILAIFSVVSLKSGNLNNLKEFVTPFFDILPNILISRLMLNLRTYSEPGNTTISQGQQTRVSSLNFASNQMLGNIGAPLDGRSFNEEEEERVEIEAIDGQHDRSSEPER
ncbi:hypothetical protein F5879DRAFT_1005019 [Lentinula edodes]|nr:hypothetical protein F5879DRAFT_1005019 [Lentinula edodes]